MTDHDVTRRAELTVIDRAKTVEALAEDAGKAKQVKEMHSERMKMLLARHAIRTGEESAARAEMHARASQAYGQEVYEIERQLESALVTIEKYSAAQSMLEAARSVLALEREKIRL